MHGLFPTQWLARDPTRDHRDHPDGRRCASQPGEAPPARSFSAESLGPSGWMGYRGESPPGSSQGSFSGARPGVASSVSAPVAAPARARGSTARWGGLKISRAVKSAALALIRFYHACLSPALPSSCRYHPSCSAYAYAAVEKWGLARGARMALGRLLRCRPFGGGGYDPVP